MGMVAIVVGGTIIVLSLLVDPSGTITHVTIALTIKGAGWLCKKIVEGMNKDSAQIIDFTSWSLAGISIVQILKNAKAGTSIALKPFQDTATGFVAMGEGLSKLVNWLASWTNFGN